MGFVIRLNLSGKDTWKININSSVTSLRLTSDTCNNMRVDGEGVIGWVDAALFIILLAERQSAAIKAHSIHVRIASHSGVGQEQVLQRVTKNSRTFVIENNPNYSIQTNMASSHRERKT